MLRDNGDEALHAAEDRAVDDDGARHDRLVRRAEAQVEALRQLEVELDRRALELAPQRVADRDVDLRPVKRTVAGIQLPLAWVVLLERLRQLLEWGCSQHSAGGIGRGVYRFGLVPGLDLAEVVVGPCGELEMELESEQAVDVLHKVEQRADLVLELK